VKCLTPSASLLVKLGSIIVHAEELASPHGHHFDRVALGQLLADPDVIAWREEMDSAALLPLKRNLS
jgi:hypothetical protein